MTDSDYTFSTTLQWAQLPIRIRFAPAKFGGVISHLELRSDGPNPITSTGYRSHFVPCGTIEAEGGPEAFTRAWLAEAEASEEWQEHLARSRQGDLFGGGWNAFTP
ncbi:hypothetical protein MWN34_10745 [Ancylobacter sp. 6x-1]|uniref:Uncharacterized protein n=1 Tax=Ancylobacter crimeensis TaxID=2579147 RepID=A0ABT0DBS6_9HYPH|nr:hypothetical protein [Ancylobacter crimeensis]MCK0197390.1 hypothetical protein [Ancylobacter crimeensis]